MSFLRKLFGGGGGGDKPAAAAGPTQDHKGFVIRATPVSEGGQYRVCGVITKDVDGVAREYTFHRADKMASKDEAIDLTFQKGRLIIDEQGDRIFG